MSTSIYFDKIPAELAGYPQWVMWRNEYRDDRPTKVPYQTNGMLAKSTDPSTWCLLEGAESAMLFGKGFDGIGYVFLKDNGVVGIDLDGCRNPQTGEIADWAKEIILRCNTYAEVSPSLTGVKLFALGKSPFLIGRNIEVDKPRMTELKRPGIEIYDHARYFAVTGWRLKGPAELQEAGDALEWLKDTYFPVAVSLPPSVDFRSNESVVERARKYLAKMPPAISGQKGHDATFHAACVLVLGFGLDTATARALLGEWNMTCVPPWSDRELDHKIASADKQPGERNYLRNVKPERWDTVKPPPYRVPPPSLPKAEKAPARVISVPDAGRLYIDAVRKGKTGLIPLGINALDWAIGGGVAEGELIVLAARPSHGKSMVGMQVVHQLAARGISSFVVSAEMSALSLGKRVLHFVSDMPEQSWKDNLDELEREIAYYEQNAAKCYIVEDCASADDAVAQIEKAIDEHGIKLAMVDYLQTLEAPGSSTTEQVRYAADALNRLRKERNITLVLLCQMSRKVEQRPKFMPVMSDIEHSGKIEQMADVIIFMAWPYKIDSNVPKSTYQFFIAKNRNRQIEKTAIECRLIPSRQMVTGVDEVPKPVKTTRSSVGDFDAWNAGKF